MLICLAGAVLNFAVFVLFFLTLLYISGVFLEFLGKICFMVIFVSCVNMSVFQCLMQLCVKGIFLLATVGGAEINSVCYFVFLRQQLLSAIADGSAPRRLCEARFSFFGIVCFLLFYSNLIYSSLLYSYLIYSYLFLSFLIYSYLGGDVGRRVGRFFATLKTGRFWTYIFGYRFRRWILRAFFYDIDLGTQ